MNAMEKFILAMDILLVESTADGRIRVGFVEDEPYLSAIDVCNLFADTDPSATIAEVREPHIQMVEIDDEMVLCVDAVGTDVILLGIQPDVNSATSKQLGHIGTLGRFKNAHLCNFLNLMDESDTGLSMDTLSWCTEHPEETQKALTDLYKYGNFDVPEPLQPFAKFHMLTQESQDTIPGVMH